MDYRLALMTGIDIPIPECQLVVHQPSIKEISYIGEKTFFTGIQCLCIYKSAFVQDRIDLSTINNFQIFMMIMQDTEAKDKKQDVKQTLMLLFPSKDILFTPNSIIFNEQGEDSIVDEKNFEAFQEVLRKIVCMQLAPMTQQAFNPKGEKAQEIVKKLMRGRERIAKEQGNKDASIFTQYLSTLTISLHLSLQSLIDLTIFQLYDLVERYSLWVNWDLDVKTRLAGGKPEDKPDNWMKNIH